MQSQLVCSGCRTILLYPRGAANVFCSVCNVVTAVPPPVDMSQLICGGCRTLLMYTRGATSVRCSCCHTVSLVPAPNHQVAHINCGNCHTTLMYPSGSQSVKCAICQYVTNTNIGNTSAPVPAGRPNGTNSSETTPTSQTVIVQNPVSVDESGKPVSNVVVGVTT